MYDKLSISVLVCISAVGLGGCPSESARAQKWDAGPAVKAGTENGRPLLAREHPHTPNRNVGGETMLSTYNNPDAGVFFRYPKSYLLEEGDVLEHSYFLKTQEELDTNQPGAELVVTVLIPEDAYPNTTFEHGSLQLSMREADSPAACRSNRAPFEQATRSGFSSANGLQYEILEEDGSVAGTILRQRRYSAFSGGQCYEFFAVVAAEQATDADGFVKPADTGKILRQLTKILMSVRLSEKK